MQVSFLSRHKFCCDKQLVFVGKHTFVATKDVFLSLWRQKTCFVLVETNMIRVAAPANDGHFGKDIAAAADTLSRQFLPV